MNCMASSLLCHVNNVLGGERSYFLYLSSACLLRIKIIMVTITEKSATYSDFIFRYNI